MATARKQTRKQRAKLARDFARMVADLRGEPEPEAALNILRLLSDVVADHVGLDRVRDDLLFGAASGGLMRNESRAEFMARATRAYDRALQEGQLNASPGQ